MKVPVKKLKKFAAPLATLAFAIILTLVLIESGLRYFFPQPNFRLVEYRDGGYFANKPNYDDFFAIIPHSFEFQGYAMRQYISRVRTNSAGIRSERESYYEKKPGTRRVLLLGDSLSFGFPLNVSESFPWLIEKSIPNLEIENASYVGAHPGTSWKSYDTEWKKYDPDIIILQGLVGSPVEDHIFVDQTGPDSQKIEFLKNSGLSMIPRDKDVAMNEILVTTGTGSAEILQIFNKEKENSTSYLSKSHVFRLIQSTKFVLGRQDFLPGRNSHPDIKLKTKPPERDYSKTLSYIRAFHTDAVNKSAKFLFILIPNRMGCISSTHDDWKKLLQKLDIEGIAYLDFYDEFCVPNKERKESAFLDKEIHLNAYGHAIIARKIANVLFEY